MVQLGSSQGLPLVKVSPDVNNKHHSEEDAPSEECAGTTFDLRRIQKKSDDD